MSLYFGGFANPFFNVINYGAFRFAALILVIAALVVLCLTVFKNGKDKEGFAKVVYDFFNFNSLCLGKLIKAAYIIVFLYYTIYGCLLLFVNPLMGLTNLVLYNVIARIIFELVMIFVKIEENTRRPRCNCDDCNCDDCGCDDCGGCCGCDCDMEYEDIDLDEDFDENDATVIIEDITDEVIEDMRIAEEEKSEKENKKANKSKE